MDPLARSWVADVLGASEVHDIRSLSFGTTSDLRLIEVDGRPFVLRRYDTEKIVDLLPKVVQYEVLALRAGRHVLGDVVPEPIAFDVTGARAGRPSLLMSFLAGKPVIHGIDPRRLATPLVALHACPIPNGLPRYHHWFDVEELAVPRWTRSPGDWSKLIELVCEREPRAPHVFLHRDYHPGNLLWQEGSLRGVVDWASSCHGPRGIDVAHTRGNLALVDGLSKADAFLNAYTELVPMYNHDPWWDAADLLSGDDEFSGVIAFRAFGADLDLGLLRQRADDWAERLVSML